MRFALGAGALATLAAAPCAWMAWARRDDPARALPLAAAAAMLLASVAALL